MTEQSMAEQDMAEQDMAEQVVGPIDYLALELPARRMKGEGLAALVDLVDRGVIRVLDLRAVTREADGTFTAVAITDLDHDGTLDLAVFEGVESGLLDDDDLRQAAELIEPGKVVALLVYENTWAAPFVAAMRRAGAELIASGRIPADEVEAMLDVLEAEEAQAQATE
jgi:dihydroorotase-like cyclic amidohydrolase